MNINQVAFSVALTALCVLQVTADNVAMPPRQRLDPKNYVQIGEKRYYISPKSLSTTALEATYFCNDDGMSLVSFETEEEWLTVKDFMHNNGYQNEFYWTSGRKYSNEWQWTGSGQLFSYTAWGTNQPNHSGSDLCVYFGTSIGWQDEVCTILNVSFMCE